MEAVLQYTRPLELNSRPWPAAEVLEEVAHQARALAAERGAPVSVRVEPCPGPVLADGEALRQALLDLAGNALEALWPQGGEVVLSGRAEEGHLLLAVEDNGLGISTEALPFVFDPLFTTKAVGVGMGLPCARRAVVAMGGELLLTHRLPFGTRALLHLPLTETDPPSPNPCQQSGGLQ